MMMQCMLCLFGNKVMQQTEILVAANSVPLLGFAFSKVLMVCTSKKKLWAFESSVCLSSKVQQSKKARTLPVVPPGNRNH